MVAAAGTTGVDQPRDQDETSTQAVTNALRELVLEGTLAPGEKLSQDHLAQRLGVSRTPLRTALASLNNDGLLVYEPNRGYSVRSFDTQDIIAAFAVRAELEGLAAGNATRPG